MVIGNLALKLEFLEKLKDSEREGYFKQVVEDIPDYLDLSKYNDNVASKLYIDFSEIKSEAVWFVKFWIYHELYERMLSPTSISSGYTALKNFLNYIEEEFFITNPTEIKGIHYKAHLHRYVYLVKNHTLEMTTANNYVTVIDGFFKTLEKHEIMDASFVYVYDAISRVPRESPEFYFSGSELEEYYKRKNDIQMCYSYKDLIKILSNLHLMSNDLYRHAILVLAHTGLRASELQNLEIDCIEIEVVNNQNIYWLSNYKTSKSKQKHWIKGQPLQIGKHVYDAIIETIKITEEYRTKADKNIKRKLFIRPNYETKIIEPLNTASLRLNLQQKVASLFGIEKATLHMFRHTYAKILYDKGVPLEYIKKYLNHYEWNMTSDYIGHSSEEIVKKYINFVSIDSFEGHAKDNAIKYRDKLTVAIDNNEFQGLAIESQAELLDTISKDSNMSINIMDHGICFIPEGSQCPNNYTDVNSCIEEHCNKFVTTKDSIPSLEKLVNIKMKFVEELNEAGYEKAYNRNKKRLNKTILILNNLKGNHAKT
ncbi:hypothetical protein CRV03_03555 [Arcobacter sp. F155]|uniref:tyrosine-type recombinase/integrase n=1 Tax=Arcobacter sp. F155 TaxID=2044512 RepID=UPI00100AA24F|nr:site-specific integrase [Arcobacter sp. F155]RXJ78058.1 hypothetical protein CRV03_03555 [Arcobacter sp. F155]